MNFMTLATPSIPFTLKSRVLLKETIFFVTKAIYRLHGLIRLQEERLLQLAGTKKMVLSSVFDWARSEPFPLTLIELPLHRLSGVEVRGWFFPRIEIAADDLEVLASVPGASHGKIILRCARQDWDAVRTFVMQVKLDMAERALQTLGDVPALPSS